MSSARQRRFLRRCRSLIDWAPAVMALGVCVLLVGNPARSQTLIVTTIDDTGVAELQGSLAVILQDLDDSDIVIPGSENDVFQPEAHPIDPIDPWNREEQTEDAIDCQDAVREFVDTMNTSIHTRDAGVINAAEYLDNFSNPLENWENDCLEADVQEITVTDVDLESLIDNLGFFYLDNKPFCSGLLIAANTVLTARHCFAPRGESAEVYAALKACMTAPAACRIKFGTYAPSHTIVTVTGSSDPQLQSSSTVFDDEDYIEIAIDQNLAFRRVTYDQPQVGDRVFLGGYVPLFDADAVKNSVVQGQNAYFKPQLRWTKDLDGIDECVIEMIDSACVYHSCQSFSGFSGSPLVKTASDGSITIVGLHIGGPDNSAYCRSSRASRFNRAVAASVIPN